MTDGSGMRASLKGNVEEALRFFASEAEWAGLNLAETEFVLEETLKCYGSTFDGAMILELFKFYRRYLGMADVGRRQQLLTRMTEFLSNGQQHRSIALLCFISADTDGQITSGAALDLAMVMPADKGDPLTGPKFAAFHGCGGVRAKLGKPGSDDEGDVAAGLLLLGDMRLLPLLEEIWERLTPEGRRRMVRRRSNLVSALMIEFLLRRLEADKEEEYFGELGAALHNLPEIAAQLPISAVMDIRRNFGLPVGKEPMELLGRETLAEAFVRIRPRLEALIARESEPKVLPAALAVWAEAAGVEIEEDSEDSEGGEDSVDEVADAEDDLEDEDEYPDVMSQELHDEFEAMSDGDGFEGISEDIYFWNNPYKTKDLSAEEVKRELTAGPVFPLLVTGIFNPFGPTLNVYLVQRDNLDQWTMALLRLNPFSCTKADLGKLDPDRVRLEPGVLDQTHGAQRMSLAMKGRVNAGLDGAHDYILRIVLGRSRMQQSFTLCHSTTAVSSQKSLERVAAAYLGTKNGRDDLVDLRDKKKRTDPWARADVAEAMRRIHQPQAAPASLAPAEAQELAGIVLDPQQQRIEILNFMQAWEGAIENAGVMAVLTRDQLLQFLLYLTPDMPNLVNIRGDFHQEGKTKSTPSTGDVPADSAQKVDDAARKGDSTPQYKGVLRLIYALGPAEALLSVGALVWALCCTEWWLLLSLVGFSVLNFLRVGGMGMRDAGSRWFAVGLYGLMLWYVGYRIQQHDLSGQPSGPSSILLYVLVFWFGLMCFLNLICFDYAKQMRDAPDKAD
jgi:hypothetical protein